MLNSLRNNELIKLIGRSSFIKVMATVAVILSLTLITQLYAVFTAEPTVEDGRAATVQVEVGEMYFEQVDADLPQNELRAQLGDTIEFKNVGSLRHSVTIEELDFDEIITPGEVVYLEVSQAVDSILVNCKFHASHDAQLTVENSDS